jgi:glutathione S-transferase
MLIGPEDQASAAHRALQPFAQVPAIEAGAA